MSNYHVQTMTLPLPLPAPGRSTGMLRRAWATLGTWARRYGTRRHLECLEDGYLKDVGLTRARADREAARPFWAN